MSLIPNTFNGLVSAVKALAEDDSLEFTAYIPTAVFMAEERLAKDVDTEGMKVIASVTASAGDPYITKPSGYRLGFDVSFRSSAGRTFITKKTDDYLQDYWPVETSTGVPKYYCDISNTEFKVAPAPVSAYTIQVKYLKQHEHLSATNQTNYYTENCSDSLFYATMSHMSEFMKNYNVRSVWDERYNSSLAALNNQGRRERKDDATPTDNTKSGMNTLTGEN